MNPTKMTALVLIVAGVLALAYGGFSYNSQSQQAKIGPIELTVTEKHDVNIPVWAGVGAIVLGGVLLAIGGRRG